MQNETERTNKVFKDLDNYMSRFADDKNDDEAFEKIKYSLRWINQNLDPIFVKNYLEDNYDLDNKEAMKSLLKEKEFDVKNYN